LSKTLENVSVLVWVERPTPSNSTRRIARAPIIAVTEADTVLGRRESVIHAPPGQGFPVAAIARSGRPVGRRMSAPRVCPSCAAPCDHLIASPGAKR
jgi:hypothetical protein